MLFDESLVSGSANVAVKIDKFERYLSMLDAGESEEYVRGFMSARNLPRRDVETFFALYGYEDPVTAEEPARVSLDMDAAKKEALLAESRRLANELASLRQQAANEPTLDEMRKSVAGQVDERFVRTPSQTVFVARGEALDMLMGEPGARMKSGGSSKQKSQKQVKSPKSPRSPGKAGANKKGGKKGGKKKG